VGVPQRIFKVISSRPVQACNFLDVPDLDLGFPVEDGVRVVYRNYATLYFVFVVDGAESELGILDLIQVRSYTLPEATSFNRGADQVFVEGLDRAFRNVCELDLVFHFDEVRPASSHHHCSRILSICQQVHHILAEVIQGGLVLETNVEEIASVIEENARARKASYAAANPLSLAGGVIGGNSRGTNAGLASPLGWLTERFTGVGSR
jgi:AP-3 complex subunit sigma